MILNIETMLPVFTDFRQFSWERRGESDLGKELVHHEKKDHPVHHHAANQRALLISFIIISGFMIVEAIGGYVSGSLALLSDAGHMLSDAISLGLSYTAILVGNRASVNNRKTFGYKRFEILAALFNGVLLLLISVWIVVEAISRINTPVDVASFEMMVIACIGLLVNLVVARVLHGGSEDNLNVHSAFLHVLGDLLGSLGAIAAAVLIFLFGWNLADPIASIVVSLIIIRSSWSILRDSINILMEAKPDHLDIEKIRQEITAIDGVDGIHDLHIWTITSEFLSLSCHLTAKDGVDRDELLRRVEALLSHYRLDHSTIQIESVHFNTCRSDCAHHGHH